MTDWTSNSISLSQKVHSNLLMSFLVKPEEWIEILNQNDFAVDLSGWQIQDTKGKIRLYVFSQGTQIDPQELLVLPRLKTKITLNNDGDGLNLIQPDNSIVDQASYDKAPI